MTESKIDGLADSTFNALILIAGAAAILVCFVFMGRDILLWMTGDTTTATLKATRRAENCSRKCIPPYEARYSFTVNNHPYLTGWWRSWENPPQTVTVKYFPWNPVVNKLPEPLWHFERKKQTDSKVVGEPN